MTGTHGTRCPTVFSPQFFGQHSGESAKAHIEEASRAVRTCYAGDLSLVKALLGSALLREFIPEGDTVNENIFVEADSIVPAVEDGDTEGDDTDSEDSDADVGEPEQAAGPPEEPKQTSHSEVRTFTEASQNLESIINFATLANAPRELLSALRDAQALASRLASGATRQTSLDRFLTKKA